MEIIKLLTALKVEQLIIYVYCESPVSFQNWRID